MILFLSIASARICLGGLEQDAGELDKLYEKIVFAHEARRVESKYLSSGFDSANGIYCFDEPRPDPLEIYRKAIKLSGDEFVSVLLRMKQDGDVTFDKVRASLATCSSREFGVTLVVADYLWPTKKVEIRRLVQQEIRRRGKESFVAASCTRGWLEYQEGLLVYRQCSMNDLTEEEDSD